MSCTYKRKRAFNAHINLQAGATPRSVRVRGESENDAMRHFRILWVTSTCEMAKRIYMHHECSIQQHTFLQRNPHQKLRSPKTHDLISFHCYIYKILETTFILIVGAQKLVSMLLLRHFENKLHLNIEIICGITMFG